MTFRITGGIRAAILSDELKSVDVLLAECRKTILESDPTVGDLPEPKIVQASMSLAVQMLLHWAHVHREEAPDPDMIPTDAIVGVVTGLGIAVAMFAYDPNEVVDGVLPAFGRAWADAAGLQVALEGEGETLQ